MSSAHTEPPNGQAVHVTTETQGAAVVLVVSGDIDMVTAPEFEKALLAALRDRPEVLVVDLSAVEFLGSAGLTALVTARQEAGSDTTLRVVAESSTTARPLQLTGLDQEIPLYRTREEALTS
ncbi:STAS domain-containing protein [Amycolatopsis rhizosphaerae]|uniref:STAS domain-containing protein n=1 Tax=Amycolatopsis rhizosphaerae TaxID=2053003 RepID=UPI001FE64725|nr:STAS domain-containing protein [Amycolatopsis rhizosphaerae]